MVSMNSWIYVLLVFYHNYVWYCCHLRWGIWSELNKSWFSNHEVKKIDKWLTIAVKNFWLRFHYTCMHTYLISISPFKLCYLALSAGCGLFWQRESLVLSDSCQWYIQSVCVFRQVLLQWRCMSIGISTLQYWGSGHDRIYHRQVHTTYHWSADI